MSKIVLNIIVFYNVKNTNLLSFYGETLKPVPNFFNFVIYSFPQRIFTEYLLCASSNRQYKLIRHLSYSQKIYNVIKKKENLLSNRKGREPFRKMIPLREEEA